MLRKLFSFIRHFLCRRRDFLESSIKSPECGTKNHREQWIREPFSWSSLVTFPSKGTFPALGVDDPDNMCPARFQNWYEPTTAMCHVLCVISSFLGECLLPLFYSCDNSVYCVYGADKFLVRRSLDQEELHMRTGRGYFACDILEPEGDHSRNS